jgi:NTE family protein
MKTALVLGGGGVTGAAWLVGALEALEAETGWDATNADRIVGTSAGSVIGALLAAGVAPREMVGGREDAALDGYADAERRAETLGDRLAQWEARIGVPTLGLGSWRLALSTMCRPHRHPVPVLLTGWMPRGFISTRPIRELIEAYAGRAWPAGGRFRAVAADYRTGRRVAFGRLDAPPAQLADAVTASCAIPGLYRPVRIDGREYVDGGICSASNLDLLRRTDADLVVCLNPMSTLAKVPGDGSLSDHLAARMRAENGRRLGHEARKLRAEGKRVVLLQPVREDVEIMGSNFLSGRRRQAIVDQARRSVAATLRDLRARDERLLPAPARARRAVARAA